MEVNGAQKQPGYKPSSKYLHLCSAEQRYFLLKLWSLLIHKMQVSSTIFENKSKYDILWREKIGLCKKLNFFTTLLPIIQSRRQTVQSDVWLMYESFFWTGSFWWTSWISSPNLTKSSKTVCKLFKTRFRMPDCQLRQNIGVCDPMTLVFELQFLQQSFRWRNSLTRAEDRWTK